MKNFRYKLIPFSSDMSQCSKLMRSAISHIAIVLLTVAMCFGCQKRSGIEALVDKVMIEAGDNSGELREF